MKRCDFMKSLTACSLTLFAGTRACHAMARAAVRRPNFLFVYTDDQRWDAMGVVQREQGARARFPWFKTPQMDRLAADPAFTAKLGAELDAQMKTMIYSVPPCADKPPRPKERKKL